MSADSSGKISLALGASRRPPKSVHTNGVKRSHAALQDQEDDDREQGAAQTVSHFDKSAGGAIDENKDVKARAPLVIAAQTNRDWREASQRNKRQKSSRLAGVGRLQNGQAEDFNSHEESKPTFGLIVPKHVPGTSQTQVNGNIALQEAQQNQELPPEPSGEASIQHKTEDELAMDALLGKTTNKGLVLPAMTEEEAFERDYKDAPAMATLDDYARVPVEEFGAALLRGMGWKDGEGIGANRGQKVEKTKIPQRRPALLGIGAKEEAAVAQELGTWGKAAKDRRGPEVIYNPVLLRDKRTGELFTEQELEKKNARDEREKYEREYELQEKRKEKERRRGRGGSMERGSERRGKDSKRDRRDGRDRRKYDSDEEYYQRKEKDRRRREREREDGDYERSRSRRYDSDRGKERNRHRDRDRRR